MKWRSPALPQHREAAALHNGLNGDGPKILHLDADAARRSPSSFFGARQDEVVQGFVYELGIDSFFGASHAMRPDGERHTHSFRIQAKFVAESVDENGMLVGFREVTTLLEEQAKRYSNQHLNDLDAFAGLQPTGENLATIVFKDLTDALDRSLPDPPQLVAITLWENPTIYVKVRRKAGA